MARSATSSPSYRPPRQPARRRYPARRWRHVFAAAVHTLNFREGEPSFFIGFEWFMLCSYCQQGDPGNTRPPRFVTAVAAALLTRHHRTAAAAALLCTLRVVFEEFGFLGGDVRMAVDGWLSYAACHATAGDGLEIDLRLDGEPVCKRKYALLPPATGAEDDSGGNGYGVAAEVEHALYYMTPKGLSSPPPCCASSVQAAAGSTFWQPSPCRR